MKIVLYGATGNSGQQILKELTNRGHKVTAVARNTSKVFIRPFSIAHRVRHTRSSLPSRVYASMKGAVEVLTRYLAKELGPRGIAVNTVAPGAIATDFSGGMVRDNPAVNKQIANLTALGLGVPDDIGPMIASLLSEENRWVNAQRIEVSGGMLI
jgi:NAD(P)-dependent dehydrogenase (short-subunit alcohol dehydrogenase family)